MKGGLWRIFTVVTVTTVGLLGLAWCISACAWLGSPNAKNVERDVLKVADIACILEHSLFPTDAIEQVCGLEHVLAPAIEQLLMEHRAAARREQKIGCPRPIEGCDPWPTSKDAGK